MSRYKSLLIAGVMGASVVAGGYAQAAPKEASKPTADQAYQAQLGQQARIKGQGAEAAKQFMAAQGNDYNQALDATDYAALTGSYRSIESGKVNYASGTFMADFMKRSNEQARETNGASMRKDERQVLMDNFMHPLERDGKLGISEEYLAKKYYDAVVYSDEAKPATPASILDGWKKAYAPNDVHVAAKILNSKDLSIIPTADTDAPAVQVLKPNVLQISPKASMTEIGAGFKLEGAAAKVTGAPAQKSLAPKI